MSGGAALVAKAGTGCLQARCKRSGGTAESGGRARRSRRDDMSVSRWAVDRLPLRRRAEVAAEPFTPRETSPAERTGKRGPAPAGRPPCRRIAEEKLCERRNPPMQRATTRRAALRSPGDGRRGASQGEKPGWDAVVRRATRRVRVKLSRSGSVRADWATECMIQRMA